MKKSLKRNKMGNKGEKLNGFIPFSEKEISKKGERVILVGDVFGLEQGKETGTIIQSGSIIAYRINRT